MVETMETRRLRDRPFSPAYEGYLEASLVVVIPSVAMSDLAILKIQRIDVRRNTVGYWSSLRGLQVFIYSS
jgi:hypothetical protein